MARRNATKLLQDDDNVELIFLALVQLRLHMNKSNKAINDKVDNLIMTFSKDVDTIHASNTVPKGS